MTLEGIVGIVEGLNPTLIRLKLDSYNLEAKKVKKSKPAKAGKAAEAPKAPGSAARPVAAAQGGQ